jgi:prepilin-type N-terminal cleavage/methylation domain-containing protein
MNRRSLKNRRGFTLVELMVVMSIISLMSSVVFASVNTARARARDSARYSSIQQMRNAIELYITKYGYAPLMGKDEECQAGGYGEYDCSAREFDTDGANGPRNQNWVALQTELREFIPTLPKDPCGQNCSSDETMYRFHYIAPRTMEVLCGCNMTNFDYAIYAENLEGTGKASYFTTLVEVESI